jgi:hypothetical protein
MTLVALGVRGVPMRKRCLHDEVTNGKNAD